MDRPEFDQIKSYEEFSRYYWYREELINICKSLGLRSDLSKIELNRVIEAYFNGEKILPVKRKKPPVTGRNTMLTKETGLIECGFTFGNRFREFFSDQTGVEHFKFNVDMVATVKAVKERDDRSFTLGDLLDIYYGLVDALEIKGADGKRLEPNFGPDRAGDIKHSNADISKARKNLGYDPEWSFERGIRAAIDWYREDLGKG